MTKAPKRADGSYLYVVESRSWGQTTTRLVASTSLKEAKAEHGWTRNTYESRRVRRATVDDVAAAPDYSIPKVRVGDEGWSKSDG